VVKHLTPQKILKIYWTSAANLFRMASCLLNQFQLGFKKKWK